ncbi:hypothetical protein ACFYE2_07085 [Kocuria sp. CPCC 205300]|uniref:hypothetical protein n=1 Tax=Kocuria sabuli TaxID=3071448 RepID=UPI0036D78C8F
MSFPEALSLTIALLALVVGVVGVCVMLAQLYVAAVGPSPCFWGKCIPSSAAPPTGTPSPAPTTTDEDTDSGETGTLAIGTCLAGDAAVPCDTSYQEQVYAHDDCSSGMLIGFLGGNPAVDVLRPDLETGRQSDRACSVRVPGGMNRSAEGVLTTESGTGWRWCRNSVTGQDVPCSDAHDEEVVSFSPRPRDQELGCRADAETYMDRGWSGVSTDLALAVVEHEAGDLCVVRPRGNNSLDGSVRRIGTRTLPLSNPL